jgi:predicted DNA-binding protein
MPISVRLSPRVEQRLAQYCASEKVTKSEAVKRALEALFRDRESPIAVSASARRFIGSDKRPGDVARHTKRLLREGRRS